MSSLTAVNTDTFESEVLNRKGATLVDFWASWCGPCRLLAPTLEKIAAERSDVNIVKVNIEENPEIAQRFRIQNIPLTILFYDGHQVDQLLGNQPKAKIESMLDRNIPG